MERDTCSVVGLSLGQIFNSYIVVRYIQQLSKTERLRISRPVLSEPVDPLRNARGKTSPAPARCSVMGA